MEKENIYFIGNNDDIKYIQLYCLLFIEIYKKENEIDLLI